MSTPKIILALFTDDAVVLRPSEIIRKTKRNTESVRASLKRLIARGLLFHIAHSQYARVATAEPLPRSVPLADLRRRIEALEHDIANLRAQVLP